MQGNFLLKVSQPFSIVASICFSMCDYSCWIITSCWKWWNQKLIIFFCCHSVLSRDSNLSLLNVWIFCRLTLRHILKFLVCCSLSVKCIESYTDWRWLIFSFSVWGNYSVADTNKGGLVKYVIVIPLRHCLPPNLLREEVCVSVNKLEWNVTKF